MALSGQTQPDLNGLLMPMSGAEMTAGPPQTRKPAATSSTTGQPQKFDPKALLNPKAAVASTSKSSTIAAHHNSDGLPEDAVDAENYGLGDMITSLHNVQEREDAPSRKRRLQVIDDDSNDDRKKAKGPVSQRASGRTITNHLKEERKQMAADGGDTIDLTNDDDEQLARDDEVQFIKESATEEVCMGTIHASCHAHLVPSPSVGGAVRALPGMWPAMSITYSRQRNTSNSIIDLFDRTGRKFANLEPKAATALCPLIDSYAINKMSMKVMLPPRLKKSGEQSGQRISESMKVELILFAPRNVAKRLTQFLSTKNFHFERPSSTFGRPYYNAQEYKPVYGPYKTTTSRPVTGPVHAVGRTVEEMRRETSSMFDALASVEKLPEMEANSAIITTELLSHQKQALSFLMDHEHHDHEDDAPRHSLWKYRSKDNGRPAWYHLITDVEVSKKPEPTKGGMLADEMGLGKTLSIIALIAETREASRQFRREEAPSSEHIERNMKGTLIICPKSVLSNWQEQVRLHTAAGVLDVYTYHGDSRMQDLNELSKYDIVLTTYNTAAAEYSDGNRARKALGSVNWFRIVLDEAHSIRNPSTKIYKACCDLEADRRWAITGTPVQNNLIDLGALIKFLRIKPFDELHAWHQHINAPFKNGDVDIVQKLHVLVGSITLRRLKDTINLPGRSQHRVYLEFSKCEALLYKKFANKGRIKLHAITGGGSFLRGKGYAHILKSLQRLRAICAHGPEMLSEEDLKEVEGEDVDNAIVIDIGDEPEFERIDDFITEKSAYDDFRMKIDSDVAFCDLCAEKMIEENDEAANEERHSSDEDESSNEEEGPQKARTKHITRPDLIGHLTPCCHLICHKCTTKYTELAEESMTADKYHNCPVDKVFVRWGLFPLCHSVLDRLEEERGKAAGGAGHSKWDESTYSGPHTKVKALLEDLRQSELETLELPEGQPPIRSVVFSGWTQYLDLIEYALTKENMGFVRIDGKMSVKQRSQALSTFNSVDHVRVMLVSIKAGGQGLNFTAANKAYVMEPQYNPGVEHQAVDRIHRIGQTRDVIIKHFIMKPSIEEAILNVQRKKEDLAKLSMERKKAKNEENKIRMEMLKELFK